MEFTMPDLDGSLYLSVRLCDDPRIAAPYRETIHKLTSDAFTLATIAQGFDEGRLFFIDPERARIERDTHLRAGGDISWMLDPAVIPRWNFVMHAGIINCIGTAQFRAFMVERAARPMPGMQPEAVEFERAHLHAVIANVIDGSAWLR